MAYVNELKMDWRIEEKPSLNWEIDEEEVDTTINWKFDDKKIKKRTAKIDWSITE